MIALAFSLLFWTNAAGEVLPPGSLEDCLAWSMADLEIASDDNRTHRGAAVSRLMSEHFQDLIGQGEPSDNIIQRQRALHQIAVARSQAGGGQAERAVCEASFPTPTWPPRPAG